MSCTVLCFCEKLPDTPEATDECHSQVALRQHGDLLQSCSVEETGIRNWCPEADGRNGEGFGLDTCFLL